MKKQNVPFFSFFLLLSLASAAYAVDIPFTLDKPANVSLGIYDGNGRLMRTLLRAKPMAAGRHTIPWDGLDRNGMALKGDFQWRLATSQGLQSEYLLSIGTSMREHHWPAQHGAICGLAVDKERIYVTAGLSEGMPQTAATTRDGAWQWVSGPTGGWMGGYDLAVDGDTLYFLGGPIAGDETDRKPRLFVQDAATGRVREGERDGLKNQVLWGTSGPLCWEMNGRDNPSRVDARDGELAVASPSTGLVVWLDPATGKEIDQLTIEGGLADIALLGGGRVLVVTKTTVVEAARGKQERTVRISGLVSPHRLAVDRVTGDLFVAEAGTSQQVKRFTATGTLLKAFGRAGGRKTGRYQARDFRDVTDIAGDGQGGFFVTESAAPRRTAHISAAGESISEWYGGQSFYSYVAPEPDDADRLWMNSYGWLTQLAADYEHGTWRPLATYRVDDALDRNLFPVGMYSSGFQVKRLDLTGKGTLKTYVWPKWNLPLLLEVDETAGLLRPVAALGSVPGTFTAPVDTTRQAPIPGTDQPDSWTLSAMAQWTIHHGGQEAWLEVLDADGKPIVSLSTYRGDPRPGITSNAGHTNYLLFNDRELMSPNSPDWPLTHGPQKVEITVAKGVATVRFGGKVTLERPVLAGDWKWPARLRLRTTKGGAISVTKAVFATAAGDQRRETAIAIEDAPTTSPPLEPASFAEAIRRLGKNPDDPAVRGQFGYFAWADANGDYALQADEVRLSSTGGRCSVLFMDDAFNVYLDNSVFTPLGRTPTGNPIWDWGRQRPAPSTPFGETRSRWADTQGNIYQTSAHGGADGYNHHWQWPATFVNATAVAKFGPDGTMLWQAGERAARGMPHPRGQMHYPINTLGVVHGCVGFADYIENPAEFWAEDGLFIGGVFDKHVEGPHPRAYSWFRQNIDGSDDYVNNLALLQYDMLLGGNLATRRNGDVLFFGCGWNNMPVYRVTGWDQIKRQEGTVTVPASSPAAARQGSGLKAEYYANGKLEGAAALARDDARIWFDDTHAWPQAPESVRWTGFVEPPLSGDFTFSFYTTDSAARLWIGGRKVLDQWNTPGKYWAEPVALEAGRRYPVKIEWRRSGGKPAFHLNWEALDLPVEHVPTTALYPELPDGQEATMLPVPVALPGIHAYDEALDVRAETQTLDLAIQEPFGKGWQLSGIANFAVAHGGDTATFEILDAEGKPVVEWTAYRGDPRPGVTGNRGHNNYMVFNGTEIEGNPGHGLRVPFTLHCADGKARLELPNGRVVERPVLAGDPTRPASLRVNSNTGTARVRIEEISVK
ncbi:MAG: PA14 domain-containing protein [Planctomycetia bacterium]